MQIQKFIISEIRTAKRTCLDISEAAKAASLGSASQCPCLTPPSKNLALRPVTGTICLPGPLPIIWALPDYLGKGTRGPEDQRRRLALGTQFRKTVDRFLQETPEATWDPSLGPCTVVYVDPSRRRALPCPSARQICWRFFVVGGPPNSVSSTCTGTPQGVIPFPSAQFISSVQKSRVGHFSEYNLKDLIMTLVIFFRSFRLVDSAKYFF